ncbi:serine/threonine-protein kinase [Chondromyces crocatus]|nr:serine/threonine-protein kinase [Chondromyces crocatus]
MPVLSSAPMLPPPRGPRASTPDPTLGFTAVEQPGAVLAGKFQILDLLGRGGMGSVWRAQDLMLGRQVAIKFIRLVQELDEDVAAEARMRFEREARAAAQLRTRHVVQIYEYGFHEDIPYIVMEMLAGETLAQRLEDAGRLTPMQSARILDQAARALELAHHAGIVHRDLKPANIFLAREDNDEIIKILDFGVAQASGTGLDGSQTATGRLVGSPFYMSPEQARGIRPLDGRSDLWSLAVILFRMVTGERAFSGDSLGAVMVQILREPIPLPSRVLPELPPSMDAFFERAFSRDRDRRFQTAGEMAQAFSAIAVPLAGERWETTGASGLHATTMGTPLSLSLPSAVSTAPASGPLAGAPVVMPASAPPSFTERPSLSQGGMTGTLTQVPWSPSVRRALWAAAGAGVTLTVTGLVLVARVAFSDPPPAATQQGATDSGEHGAAPARSASPTADATTTRSTPPAPPVDEEAEPVDPHIQAAPSAESASTATPATNTAVKIDDLPPVSTATAASTPASQPVRPSPPKRKPKWY